MAKITLPLSEEGAVVEVLVGVSTHDAKDLHLAGQPVPAPIRVSAVLDTGALQTCVDTPIIQQLGLTAIDQIPIASAAGIVTCDRFDISLTILHPSLPRGKRRMAKVLTVAQVNVDPSIPQHVWIGLDVLNRCDFCYRGKKGNFTLEF